MCWQPLFGEAGSLAPGLRERQGGCLCSGVARALQGHPSFLCLSLSWKSPFAVCLEPLRVPDPASNARATRLPLVAASGGGMFVLWVLTGRAASDLPVFFLLCLNLHLSTHNQHEWKGPTHTGARPMGCLRRPGPARSPKVVSLCPGHALLRIQLLNTLDDGCGLWGEGVGEESQREGGWAWPCPGMFSPRAPPPTCLEAACSKQDQERRNPIKTAPL